MKVQEVLLWLQRDASEDEIRQVQEAARRAVIEAAKDKLFWLEPGQRVRYTDQSAPRLSLSTGDFGIVVKVGRNRVSVKFDDNPNGAIAVPPHMVELAKPSQWKEPVNAADRIEGRSIEEPPPIPCDHPETMVIQLASWRYCLRCKQALPAN